MKKKATMPKILILKFVPRVQHVREPGRMSLSAGLSTLMIL
jgi:hypothetical protein